MKNVKERANAVIETFYNSDRSGLSLFETNSMFERFMIGNGFYRDYKPSKFLSFELEWDNGWFLIVKFANRKVMMDFCKSIGYDFNDSEKEVHIGNGVVLDFRTEDIMFEKGMVFSYSTYHFEEDDATLLSDIVEIDKLYEKLYHFDIV